MATPDYLQPIVFSGRLPSPAAAASFRVGRVRRPSVTSLVWAALDFVTALTAGIAALTVRAAAVHDASEMDALHFIVTTAPHVLLLYVTWFAVLLIFFSRSSGLYGAVINRSGLHEQRMTVQAAFASGLLLCGTLYLTRAEMISRAVVVLLIVFTAALLSVRRALWRRVVYNRYRLGLETRNVLIVGAGRVAHALRNHLDALRHLGFRFKGFVALTDREAGSGDADIVGEVRDTLALARSLFVDEIFLSVPAEKRLVLSLVEEARAAGIDVRVVPDLYDGLAWNAPVEYIGQFPTIPLHRRDLPVGAFLFKRALDTCAACVGMVFGLPIFLLIAVAIKLDSPGPVFYCAQRMGRKARIFNCYKFRTMCSDADRLRDDLEPRNERDGVLFKIANDPRITRVGRLLRKYSLDELPQCFNVLRGEMSLVGPRPPLAAEVEQYQLAHLRRLDVLPGMTGLWQVEARQNPSFDSYISLDTAYVETWSLWLDLKILARTVDVVLSGTGT